jgi:hypothetical protein
MLFFGCNKDEGVGVLNTSLRNLCCVVVQYKYLEGGGSVDKMCVVVTNNNISGLVQRHELRIRTSFE